MFLASGAFIGLEHIIKKRTSSKSLGFGAPITEEHKLKVDSIQGMVSSIMELSFITHYHCPVPVTHHKDLGI